jgi:hypothetical protein
MDTKIIAGEPVDALIAAFRHLEAKKTRGGWFRISATMDRELAEPFVRALGRIARELLDEDRSRGRPDERTASQCRADALVVLAERLTDALSPS